MLPCASKLQAKIPWKSPALSITRRTTTRKNSSGPSSRALARRARNGDPEDDVGPCRGARVLLQAHVYIDQVYPIQSQTGLQLRIQLNAPANRGLGAPTKNPDSVRRLRHLKSVRDFSTRSKVYIFFLQLFARYICELRLLQCMVLLAVNQNASCRYLCDDTSPISHIYSSEGLA